MRVKNYIVKNTPPESVLRGSALFDLLDFPQSLACQELISVNPKESVCPLSLFPKQSNFESMLHCSGIQYNKASLIKGLSKPEGPFSILSLPYK